MILAIVIMSTNKRFMELDRTHARPRDGSGKAF